MKDMKDKQIQIPTKLFNEMYILTDILKNDGLTDKAYKLIESIQEQIEAKFEAMERRTNFSTYKTSAVGSDEREVARQTYLDSAGTHKDWRTKKEKSYQDL